MVRIIISLVISIVISILFLNFGIESGEMHGSLSYFLFFIISVPMGFAGAFIGCLVSKIINNILERLVNFLEHFGDIVIVMDYLSWFRWIFRYILLMIIPATFGCLCGVIMGSVISMGIIDTYANEQTVIVSNTYILIGYIDSKYPITMNLAINENGSVSGTYYYNKIKVDLYIRGTIDNSYRMEIKESIDKNFNEVVGKFSGTFNPTDTTYSGTFINFERNDPLPFNLTLATE